MAYSSRNASISLNNCDDDRRRPLPPKIHQGCQKNQTTVDYDENKLPKITLYVSFFDDCSSEFCSNSDYLPQNPHGISAGY